MLLFSRILPRAKFQIGSPKRNEKKNSLCFDLWFLLLQRVGNTKIKQIEYPFETPSFRQIQYKYRTIPKRQSLYQELQIRKKSSLGLKKIYRITSSCRRKVGPSWRNSSLRSTPSQMLVSLFLFSSRSV